jgi:hypothetical protein
MFEIVNVDAGPPSGRNPTPVRNVGDGALVADQVVGLGVTEMFVEDAIEPTGLVLVSIDAVFDLLGSVLDPLALAQICGRMKWYYMLPCGSGWPVLALVQLLHSRSTAMIPSISTSVDVDLASWPYWNMPRHVRDCQQGN